MKWNNRFKGAIFIIASFLMFMPIVCAFAESAVPNPSQTEAAQPSVLTKADLEAIQQIVDESVGKKIRPVIRDIAELKQPKEAGFKEIIGGIGYILGIVGVAMYFLSKKEK